MPKTKILNNLFRSNNYFLSDSDIVRQGRNLSLGALTTLSGIIIVNLLSSNCCFRFLLLARCVLQHLVIIVEL